MPVLNRLWEHWYAFQGKTKIKRSLKWLADGAGVSRPTLRHYLDNTTRSYDPEVIDRLCEMLDIPVEAFFYRVAEPRGDGREDVQMSAVRGSHWQR